MQRLELNAEQRAIAFDMRDVEDRRDETHRRRETFLRALVDAHTTEQALRVLARARIDHLLEVNADLAELLDEVRVGEPLAAGATA